MKFLENIVNILFNTVFKTLINTDNLMLKGSAQIQEEKCPLIKIYI